MTEICSAAQMKRLDQNCDIEFRELMQNAAECLFRRIESLREKHNFSLNAVAVVCGVGSNGGDGYALAILLRESGREVKIVASGRPAVSDALYYFSLCADMGIETVYYEEEPELSRQVILDADFVVDALFGTGLSRRPEEPYEELIACINSCGGFVFSVDLPSGIYADSANFDFYEGEPLCVRADATSTFVMKKPAHVSQPSLDFCGEVYLEDIGIPPEVISCEKFTMFQPDDSLLQELFRPRERNSNKGSFGKLLSLCGCPNMTGAACLAAQGAMRCGVGLTVCAAKPEVISVLQNKMSFPVFLPLETDGDGLFTREALDLVTGYPGITAILAGCGLGRSKAAFQAVEQVVKNSRVPVVLDADALNIISENRALLSCAKAPIIITPHPGEMARLCATTVEQVQNDRVRLAKRFAAQYNVTVLLKGDASVTASPDGRLAFNCSGSPALAKGGTGDVLAGIVASLAAQGHDMFYCAVAGAYLHGLAGELGESRFSQYGLSPEDLPVLAAEIINRQMRHTL